MIKATTGDYLKYDGQIVQVVRLRTPVDIALWLRPVDNSGPDILVIEDDPEFQAKAKPIKTIIEVTNQ